MCKTKYNYLVLMRLAIFWPIFVPFSSVFKGSVFLQQEYIFTMVLFLP